jgi:O-acetyl-ADP-ribose deacetylase (regulator of RNase III)
MIDVRIGQLGEVEVAAVVRPVASDFTPVTGAMRRFDEVAGPEVREQCTRLGELPLGSAAITGGGELAADYIVHVAIRSSTRNATSGVVRQGLQNALRRLEDWGLDSVAMVPLGTGAGNLDPEESAEIMIPLLAQRIRDSGRPSSVVVVVEDAYHRDVFQAAVARHTGRRGEAESGARP